MAPFANPWLWIAIPVDRLVDHGGGRSQPVFRSARHRHGRLHPHTRVVLQRCGIQANLRIGFNQRIIPLTLSLDHCGPLSGTVEDARSFQRSGRIRQVDIASVEHPKEDYVAAIEAASLRTPGWNSAARRILTCWMPTLARPWRMQSASSGGSQEREDCTLPSTRNIVLAGESYAYHEDLYLRGAGVIKSRRPGRCKMAQT